MTTGSLTLSRYVGPAMQNRRAGLHGRGRAVFLPSRAEQHQGRLAAVEVHGHCAASGRADDHVGMMLVTLGLGNGEGGGEVVEQFGVEDGVTVLGEEGWFDAGRGWTASRGGKG